MKLKDWYKNHLKNTIDGVPQNTVFEDRFVIGNCESCKWVARLEDDEGVCQRNGPNVLYGDNISKNFGCIHWERKE